MATSPTLLTVRQVGAVLNRSYWNVLDLINSGELPGINIGGKRTATRWRVDQADLNRWIESRRVAS